MLLPWFEAMFADVPLGTDSYMDMKSSPGYCIDWFFRQLRKFLTSLFISHF